MLQHLDGGLDSLSSIFDFQVPEEKKKEVQEADLKQSVQALSEISQRLRKGSSIMEVNTAFEAHEFPVLERKASQMALLAAVERSSKEIINVNEIIAQDETQVEKAPGPKQEMRKKSLAKVGLTAFMATAIKEPERADEIISSLHLGDFEASLVEKQFARIILQSSELDIAQVLFCC